MIQLTKNIFGHLKVHRDNLIGVFGPHSAMGQGLSDVEIAERLAKPIDTLAIPNIAKGKKTALVVTDDNTRLTPLSRILPPVLNLLENAGLKPENIKILIGLGTHRPMTSDEIAVKFGKEISEKYQIFNHEWDNPDALISLGSCDLGFEIVINKMIQEADLVISVGNIVPHATAGFSGGGKTIMPGICGEKTIEDTHWSALGYDMSEILGNFDNKVRKAIVSVCRKAGLAMIINAILFNGDQIYDLVVGDVETAHKKGIEISKQVYGVSILEKADIVLAEAFPTDIDLRQAIKAICSADLICKDDGIIILPAECPEGIAPQFPDFVKYGFKNPDRMYEDVESGRFQQKLLAYTLVAIGRVISKRVKAILVSPNIPEGEAMNLGFLWAPDLQRAVDDAMAIAGCGASIAVLKQAGEILPIIGT